jgi:hypothetical protein
LSPRRQLAGWRPRALVDRTGRADHRECSRIAGGTQPAIRAAMPPGALHEGLPILFRDHPALAATLLRDALGVDLGPFDAATLAGESTPVVDPAPLACDALVRLERRGRLRTAIVVEVQLRRDRAKRAAWPVYVAVARRTLGVPVFLLVVTMSRSVGRWAARPIADGALVVRPLVIGPEAVPCSTDIDEAALEPELAVLSALVHGAEARGDEVLAATACALGRLGEVRGGVCTDFLLSMLRGAVREKPRRARRALVAHRRRSRSDRYRASSAPLMASAVFCSSQSFRNSSRVSGVALEVTSRNCSVGKATRVCPSGGGGLTSLPGMNEYPASVVRTPRTAQ